MRINYGLVRLAGSLLLVGGFWLTADVAHGSPIHPEGKATIVAAVPSSVSSLRLLGYGLFLVHIGLKPFQSSRLADLKLHDRPAVPEPALQSQS
jgi:hypothetical protein